MQNNSSTDVNEALMNIVKGNVSVGGAGENIFVGPKLKNEVLRKLADAFRNQKNEERYIVEIILALDEAAEKGYLTNELFEEIKKNPDILKNNNLKE
jgi:hypothetical protein